MGYLWGWKHHGRNLKSAHFTGLVSDDLKMPSTGEDQKDSNSREFQKIGTYVKCYGVLSDEYSCSVPGMGAWAYRGDHPRLQPQKMHGAWLDLF